MGSRRVMASRSGGQQDALAEQAEAGPAVHLPLDHLDPVDVALGDARAVGQGEPGGDACRSWRIPAANECSSGWSSAPTAASHSSRRWPWPQVIISANAWMCPVSRYPGRRVAHDHRGGGGRHRAQVSSEGSSPPVYGADHAAPAAPPRQAQPLSRKASRARRTQGLGSAREPGSGSADLHRALPRAGAEGVSPEPGPCCGLHAH